MSKHTPGPWAIEQQRPDAQFTSIGEPIAVIGGEATGESVEFIVGRHCDYGEHGEGQTTANARLIASAPDLLEALIPFVAYFNKQEEAFQNRGGNPAMMPDSKTLQGISIANWRKAQAAIAKATA